MPDNNQKTFCRARLPVFCALAAAITSVQADTLLDEPLSLSERSPLSQHFNLPAMRGGALLAPGSMQWRMGVDVANNFVHAANADERFDLDGESQRYELGVRYGVGERWEVGVMVPWIAYNGGALDSFIEDWHRLWGFSAGNRNNYPRGQLRFSYQRNGRTEFVFDSAEAGFGDVQVQVANRVFQSDRDSVALIATLNLPTGDEHKLTGAGGTSAGVQLAVTHAGLLDLPLTLSANLGAQTLPKGDVLSDRQKSTAWFGGGEIAWAPVPDWRWRAQVNMHSALYDSALT
ncbi:MAG TPA: DUF3187 family protein, partial [Spongiibacteraceae bacterium]|nr:DUF3187 family protein [Spongiibacteraceae bacterium]